MNSGWISNETIFFLNLLTLIFQSKPIHSLTMKSGLFFHNLFFFLSSLLLCHLKLFKLSCLFLKTEKSYIFFPKVRQMSTDKFNFIKKLSTNFTSDGLATLASSTNVAHGPEREG